jgi:hypothetical protein
MQPALIEFRAMVLSVRLRVAAHVDGGICQPGHEITLHMKNPMDCLADRVVHLGIEDLKHDEKFPSSTEFYHRYLILNAVSLAFSDAQFNEKETLVGTSEMLYSVQQFRQFLDLKIKPTRPDIYRAFNDAFPL